MYTHGLSRNVFILSKLNLIVTESNCHNIPFIGLNTLGTFKYWLVQTSRVQTFQLIVLIYRRGIFVLSSFINLPPIVSSPNDPYFLRCKVLLWWKAFWISWTHLTECHPCSYLHCLGGLDFEISFSGMHLSFYLSIYFIH